MMKERVQRVLARQKPFLRTPEERAAFDTGVSNWNAYYTTVMNNVDGNTNRTV
ncbi:hypothetical protein ACFQRK_13530 [Parapedobacter sp. GCM10030251]|uniref:hypothetical protein n=1 Tax=Parapedobacter sp. GCM10030251 TaxID=3273419 RepID=UPI00361A4136